VPDPLLRPDGSPPPEEPAFWTFHPDGTPVAPPARGPARGTAAAPGATVHGHTDAGRPPVAPDPGRSTFFPQVAVVIAVGLLLTALLMATHAGPFASSPRTASPAVTASGPDLKGSWHVLVFYHQAFFVETLDVAYADVPTGVFSGTLQTPVGTGAMAGRIVGTSVSFTMTVGTATETGTATLGTSDGRLTMSGDFTNSAGGSGSITATRTGP